MPPLHHIVRAISKLNQGGPLTENERSAIRYWLEVNSYKLDLPDIETPKYSHLLPAALLADIIGALQLELETGSQGNCSLPFKEWLDSNDDRVISYNWVMLMKYLENDGELDKKPFRKAMVFFRSESGKIENKYLWKLLLRDLKLFYRN